jgi:hypothetical protein
MFVEHRKPYRKSVTLRNEIDLLLHFPFGGLIGGELLPHRKVPKITRNLSVKGKRASQQKRH